MSAPEMPHPQESAVLAFVAADLSHPEVISFDGLRDMSVAAKTQIMSDYLDAALRYFRESDDPYLRELGTTADQAFEKDSVNIIFADTTVEGLRCIEGIDESVFQMEGIEHDPDVFVHFSGTNGSELLQKGALVLPLQFALSAHRNPVRTLSIFAGTLSKIRDFENRRLFAEQDEHDERAGQRIEASTAQLLLTTQRHDQALGISDNNWDLLRRYPNGVESLPNGVGYRSKLRRSSRVNTNISMQFLPRR